MSGSSLSAITRCQAYETPPAASQSIVREDRVCFSRYEASADRTAAISSELAKGLRRYPTAPAACALRAT